MRFAYTTDDGLVAWVIPAPKADLEELFGQLTTPQYRALVITRSIPDGKPYIELPDDYELPDRAKRAAWAIQGNEIVVDESKLPPKKFTPLNPRQFWRTARAMGITRELVRAKIIQLVTDPDDREDALIDFEEASVYERTDPLLNAVASELGITPEQLDTVWEMGSLA